METDAQGNLTPEGTVLAAEAVGPETITKQLMEEANRAQQEADANIGAAQQITEVEAARAQAARFMAERRFADAKKALEEADELEKKAVDGLKAAEDLSEAPGSKRSRIFEPLRSRIQKRRAAAEQAPPIVEQPVAAVETEIPDTSISAISPVDQAVKTVSLYSKIAIVAGLLPGGLLNFAAVLAVQVTMVWKIANAFGHREGKERIRGSILSLVGAVLPTTIGHGVGALAIAAIPVALFGTVFTILVTPVFAYALTKAVGNVFTMHFESGGTLLTFDPKAFQDYFIREFQAAGGTLKTSVPQEQTV